MDQVVWTAMRPGTRIMFSLHHPADGPGRPKCGRGALLEGRSAAPCEPRGDAGRSRDDEDKALGWLRISAVVGIVALVVAAWAWIPSEGWDVHRLSATLAPYRNAWYAPPLVMLAFVVLAVVPVLLLIAVTGVVFGPVLGPIYALAGSLAGGSAGFLIGRWLGTRRVKRLGGERVRRLTQALGRNGTFAVYLVRKVPMPFLLANIIVGASSIAYRDFVIGTVLGMTPIIVALAGFGHHLTRLVDDPSPGTIIGAAMIVAVPLTLAWIINRQLRERTVA